MKTKKTIIASLWIVIALLVWSCNNDTESIDPSQESIVAKNLLVNSNAALSRLRGNGISGPMGALYGNFQHGRQGRVSQSPSAMFRNSIAGSTNNGTKTTCLTETWEDDGKGNYTFTLDFGDGCDYYGEWLKGKLVEKGSYNETSFNSTTTYTDFGGQDWTINGTHSYSGTWGQIIGTNEPDSTNFSATYEFSADLKTSYIEFGYDSTAEVSIGERLIEVDYVAQGSEEVDQDGYTIKTRTETVSLNTGEFFKSQVDIPLYFNFNCNGEVWVYVSGQESGSYTVGNETGTYSINYGDGACDNIITVTENGTSEEIDLGKLWNEWEEDSSS